MKGKWIYVLGVFILLWILAEGGLEFSLFLLLIGLFVFSIRFLTKRKKKVKKNVKYKYQNIKNDDENEIGSEIGSEINELNLDEFEDSIKECERKLKEHEELIRSFDFREFEGKKNVPWNEIYDYLWIHCRYKGIMMWIKYMNELVKKGVMNQSEIKLVINKAGNYIPWDYRKDLEVEINERRKEIRDEEIKNKKEFERNEYWEYKNGLITKDELDKRLNRIRKKDLKYLQVFDYDEYLKEKG